MNVNTTTVDPRIIARDAIVRLATTPEYRGDLGRAALELAQRPHWQTRKNALRAGLTLARTLVDVWGNARNAERAINQAADRAAEALLDAETC